MFDLLKTNGYLLFVKDAVLLKQLKEIGRLYVNIKRKWDRTTIILFIKSNNGIFLEGYGYVDFVLDSEELTGLENIYCVLFGYKQCLGFKTINWLPRAIEITHFLNYKNKVGSLNGKYLNEACIDEILDHVEEEI